MAGDCGEGVVAGAAGVVAAHLARMRGCFGDKVCQALTGFENVAVVQCDGSASACVIVAGGCADGIERYDLRGMQCLEIYPGGAGWQHVLVVTMGK